MNGTNKAAVGVVFGIALVYSVLCLMCTVKGLIEDDAFALYLFFPHGGEMAMDLAEIPGLEYIPKYYGMFLDLFGEDTYVKLGLVVLGFVLSVAGMLTPWSIGVKGPAENPVQYLWTQRPGATVRALGAPWGLIGAAASKHKALAIIPIILLPFYAVWSLLITIVEIIPFFIMKGVIGSKVRKAVRREERENPDSSVFTVCPRCKRRFQRPKVRCSCGLMVEYPVPGDRGYKTHTCNNGHNMPCVAGQRGSLRTVCPYCSSDLDSREARPISIALVGGLGSGKTTMMLAAVGTVMQVARARSVTVEAATPGVDRQAVAAKDVAAKTASGELDSEILYLRSLDMTDRQIIINDISGSEFEAKQDKVIFQEYYKYSDGIIFAFDPLTLERRRGQTPMEVFESFHHTFAQVNGFGPGKVSDIPFAIVATKVDVMSNPVHSADVRKFLIDSGQQPFVRVAESLFSDVRYFAVSSIGDDFKSAAAPFWWIIGKKDQELASKVPVLSV